MGVKFPFAEQFTLKESDVIETLREKLSDRDIIIRWAYLNASKQVKKTSTEVKNYLTRNPRGKS